MKSILSVCILLLGMSSAFAECSPVVKLAKVPTTPWIGATLENGLIAVATDENRKALIQTAFIANAKVCYSEASENMVYHFSVER